VWCSALWDLNWALIGWYGQTTDLSAGYTGVASGGSAMMLRLVLNAMTIQPANPSLFQARHAELQVDLNLTGGANQGLIWQTFARCGFGFSASTASSSASTDVEAFDVPSAFPSVVSASLTQSSVLPVESIPIRFTKPINTSTFSVADDVLSLASPSGANLKGLIGGVVWSGGNTILTLSLPAQSRVGQYTLLLGPAINASDT